MAASGSPSKNSLESRLHSVVPLSACRFDVGLLAWYVPCVQPTATGVYICSAGVHYVTFSRQLLDYDAADLLLACLPLNSNVKHHLSFRQPTRPHTSTNDNSSPPRRHFPNLQFPHSLSKQLTGSLSRGCSRSPTSVNMVSAMRMATCFWWTSVWS